MPPDFNSLGRLAGAAIEDRVIPGLVVGAQIAGCAPLLAAYGLRQVEPEPLPAEVDTVYDLASLTKAVVTSVLVMKAIERGVLALDRPLGEHLPGVAARPDVTLRHVLAHAGGFPAHRKFYEPLLAHLKPPRPAQWGEVAERSEAGEGFPASQHRAAVIAAAAAEPLVYAPGTRSLYSDLGFILLGAVVEAAMGARLDTLAERDIFAPLQLASLGFRPAPAAPPARDLAPTERCPVRGRMILGEVHDLNAWAMGGIAGHAGLFGNVRDLLRLALALAAAYHGRGAGGGASLISQEVLREFWRPAGIPGSTWRLGWDGPAPTGSLAGALLSRQAVGHLAFTGCSLWIDPEAEACVVVLANRVHPEVRDDARFRALRPLVNDEALRAIGYRAR